MRTKLLLFIMLLASLGHISAGVASEIMFISPTRVYLSEKNKVSVMNITNTSDVERTYRAELQNVIMNENGMTTQVKEFPYSAKDMIRFYPRQFKIAAGQRQAVRIMAKVPADTPDGEYHVHIRFLEDGEKKGKTPEEIAGSGKATVSAALSYSAMIPIVLAKGNVESTIDWLNPQISKVTTEGAKPNTYQVTSQLTRSGNGEGRAYLDIIYVSPSGEEKQLGKRRNAYIYREIDKRDYNFNVTIPEAASGGKLKLRVLSGEKTNPVPVKEVLLSIP